MWVVRDDAGQRWKRAGMDATAKRLRLESTQALLRTCSSTSRGGQQRLGVWMQRVPVEFLSIGRVEIHSVMQEFHQAFVVRFIDFLCGQKIE